ncbi:glycosyltransferase family 2 protein [Bacteroidota bacterium]
MEEKKRVGILIVLYNSITHLDVLINSIQNQIYENFKLYFYDCNSSEDEGSYLRNIYPQADIFSSHGNIGFAKANNLLAQKAIKDGADYLFVLNPDMELSENTLSALVTVMESDRNIAACSSVLLFGAKEKNIIQLFGQSINFKTQKKTFLYANQLLSSAKLPEYLQVDFVNGGSLFIRIETIKQIGLFDEDYFMYNDEIDLAYRITQIGKKVIVTSETKIWHNHDWSKENIYGYKLMYYYMMRNRVLYFKKYGNYIYLLLDIISQILSLPLKIKMFIKIGSLGIIKYYYLGLWRGLIGEKGISDIKFK